MSGRKQQVPPPPAPAVLPQPAALDPRSLLQAYRRAAQATKRDGATPSLAQSQFTAALHKLRARLKTQAPILRATGLDKLSLPHSETQSGILGLDWWARQAFWRRQQILNEAVASVVNDWPRHAGSLSAEVWLKDEVRPHLRSMPMPGSSHRSGILLPRVIWGAKAVTTLSLTAIHYRALRRLQQTNQLFYRALEALVSVGLPTDSELEALIGQLAQLAVPAPALSNQLGFPEQERFVCEAAVALAALLLPGEGALDLVYSSWRTAQEARAAEELTGSVSGKVSFIFAGEGAAVDADELLSSLRGQPGGREAFVQHEGRSLRGLGATQRLPFREIRLRATGDWVALVTEPVSFAPLMVEALLDAAKRDPAMRLAYSDHDERSADGGFTRPFFKPGWSPELFFEADYLGGVLFVSRELFSAWAAGVERVTRAEVCRLVLSAHSKRLGIGRIPRVLWHRPVDAHPADPLELAPVIQEHLRSPGHPVEVLAGASGRRVKWPVTGEPLVSIIVPFKDKPQLLDQLLNSFEQHESWRNYEFILVSNNSRDGATFRLLSSLRRPEFVVRKWDRPFNYQAINNHAVRAWARGEHLLFLNNDVSWAGPGVLDELVGHSQRQEIGVVGASLRYPRGRLQHAGVTLGIGGSAAHPFSGVRPNAKWTAYGLPGWTRNYLAVTGACMMMRRSVFDEVKGFDEQLVVSGGDVDLCLRIGARGYRVVNTPHLKVIHHESATRSGMTIPASDAWKCFESFHSYLKDGDPYYNPNLSLTSMDVLPRLDERSAEELATQLLSLQSTH